MWEESWINLMMKMKDMPYYSYSSGKSTEPEVKKGSIDILKERFGKYIEK